MYKTKGKSKILEVLKEHNGTSLTIKEIKKLLEESKVSIGLTTIYRYLNYLKEKGEVLVSKGDDGEKSYQLINKDCSNHLHVECGRCKKINHLDCDCSSEIINLLEKKHGFAIDGIKGFIKGTCNDCIKGEKYEI